MIRAVVDTNVYVAATLSRAGAPARIVKAIADGLVEPIVCPRLLAELTGVLDRPKIARRVSASVAAAYATWLERVADIHPDPLDAPTRTSDPNDDFLIALALESGVRMIVSGDAHLQEVAHEGVRVLTPAAFASLAEGLR